MTKLIITPLSMRQVEIFSQKENSNIFFLGIKNFSLRPSKVFSLEEINKIVKINNKGYNYVVVNKIIHESELIELEKILITLSDYGVYGVVFSDLAIQHLVKKNKLSLKLYYKTETTITNEFFSLMAKELKIDTIEIAHEISLKEANYISNHKSSEVSLNIHGHIYMYQSMRKLLTNYQELVNKKFNNDDLFLYDQERENYYPIVEDDQGTHLLSQADLLGINFLDKINDNFDYFVLDGYRYSEEEYYFLVTEYLHALCLKENNLSEYQNKKMEMKSKIVNTLKNHKFSNGFYLIETVY